MFCSVAQFNHRCAWRTAIAAGGIWTTQIDFALKIAAPGGLTSGFALPIWFAFEQNSQSLLY